MGQRKESEFSFIKKLCKLLPVNAAEVIIGCGDDAAVLKEANGNFGVYTVDTLAENSHFKNSWKNKIDNFYYYLGRKLLSISISDIASMGCNPKIALISLGTPFISEDIYQLYSGLMDVARVYGISLIGGDTVYSQYRLFSLFLKGEGKGYMLRSKSQIGDIVAVTGTFGDSKAGLEILEGKLPWNSYLVMRFINPTPRLSEGLTALKEGVRCCTDVSDGLVFNLYTIAEASGVSIHLESSKIPLSQELISLTGEKRAKEYALFGGEDYELIITFPEYMLNKLEIAGFKPIGTVKSGSPRVFIDGEPVSPKGYDHFKGGNR